MSDKDEVASVSASHVSQPLSAKEEITKDSLTPDHLESLYTDLPSDATALKAIVGTMRLELSKSTTTISALKEEIDEVKASHSVVLQRSAEWQDELETLRLRVPQLEQELAAEKSAREAESDRVKDLRIRAEESRRAIMRLQGEQSDARAKAKVDNRRSWVPPPPQERAVRDEQEELELKKSKRASLAFGPNALNLNSLAGRPGSVGGHRRTASGGRSVSGNSKGEGEEEEPLSPTFANGLRGLRLSGTAGMNGTGNTLLLPTAGEDGGSAPNSRRSSFRSDAGKSPRLAANDLPIPDSADLGSSLGARLSVPTTAASIQRNSLLQSPALSQGAASSVGFGSPIIEDNEEEDPAPTVSKALPNLPPRDGSLQDKDLRAKEVEIERLTRELTEMRLGMEEALEARKASEACLKALRDFIASHDAEADKNGLSEGADAVVQRANSSVGAGLLKGVKLPPLPTDDIGEEEEAVHATAPRGVSAGLGGGWSMKLPTLMRKATTSSSNGPTPTDEDAAGGGGSVHSSPSAPGGPPAVPAKSIGSSFANFGNLLSSAASTTPQSEGVASPQSEGEGQGSGFRTFNNWFKRSSVLNTPSSSTADQVVEEKVMSPPFRSLDQDQLSISRQSLSEPLATPGTSSSASSIRTPSGASALATAARFGDEEEKKKVAESLAREEVERGVRAQWAKDKTQGVEDVPLEGVPSFD